MGNFLYQISEKVGDCLSKDCKPSRKVQNFSHVSTCKYFADSLEKEANRLLKTEFHKDY